MTARGVILLVAQISNLLYRRFPTCRLPLLAFADWKSAIQQIRNLRYRGAALLIIAIFPLTFSTASAQTAYFADGYHGGYYGHYPPWVTQFMVDNLNDHSKWKLNLEIEPETWDWARTNTPESYKAFKAIVDSPLTSERIEFVNPAYAQGYLWNMSGESIIRQFSYGMEKIHAHFPNVRFTTYSSEEPCFTSALPGILKSFGFDSAVLKNPNTCWGGYTRAFGGELVNWIGPEGTSLCTVPRYEVEALKPDSAWETTAAQNSKEFIQASLDYGITRPVGMCFQDAGWRNGPWLGEGRHTLLPSEYVTWHDYIFKTAALKPPKQDWHLSQEDVRVSLVWGAQAVQQIAQRVRSAENQLLTAEKMAALAQFYQSAPWPKSSVDEAWRTLFLSEHHDCWIVPYNRQHGHSWAEHVVQWTDGTKNASEDLIQRSLTALSTPAETNKALAIRVFNTMGIARNGLATVVLPGEASTVKVFDSHNKEIVTQVTGTNSKSLLFQAEVPALGFSTYRIEDASQSHATTSASATLQANGTYKVETDLYTLVVDPAKGGTIQSLVARETGKKELVDKNSARYFNEVRGYFWEDKKFFSNTETPAKVTVIENGPLRVRLEIQGRIGIHPVTQQITLVEHQRRIDFGIRIDWQGNPGIGADYAQTGGYHPSDDQKAFYDDRYKLMALFPLNQKASAVAKNAPFDVTESQLTNTFFTKWSEIKNNVLLNWVDVADASRFPRSGVALLSDHTTSYSQGPGSPLGLTLQYSGVGLWGRDYRIAGPTEVNYSLVPHAGNWNEAKIWTADEEWNEPLLARLIAKDEETAKSLLDVGQSGFEVSSLRVQGDDYLVRLFNAEGNSSSRKISFDGSLKQVEMVKLNGEAICNLPVNKFKSGKTIVSLAIPKFGFATLRFQPVAHNLHSALPPFRPTPKGSLIPAQGNALGNITEVSISAERANHKDSPRL